MNISKYIVRLLFVVLGSQFFFSCNKLLNVEPTRFSPEESHWETIQDARSGLLGVYSLMRTATTANNAHWLYGELRSGDFVSYNRKDLESIINGQLNSSSAVVQNLTDWRRFYAVINAANLFLEKAPKILTTDRLYSEENLNLDLAQVRVLRAFAYYYICRIWGDVPFILTSSDNGDFPTHGVTDQSTILQHIANDVKNVLDVLPYRYGIYPLTYYGSTESRWAGVLMNKVSAYSLLSHIYALNGDYINTEIYTRRVFDEYNNLQNGIGYSTVSYLTGEGAAGFFYGSRARHLIGFGFNYSFGESSSDGHIESLTLASPVVSRSYPDIFVNKDSINSIFNLPGDLRFGVDTTSGEPVSAYFLNYNSETPIFSKIRSLPISDGTFAKYSSAMVFTRLEEIALLRAEALAVLNRFSEAASSLNVVKANRGIQSFNINGNQDRLIDEIFAERRRELLGEGWRWYDLIRYHKIKGNDPEFQNLINNKGIYWPISSTVLLNNNKLSQNPYWN